MVVSFNSLCVLVLDMPPEQRLDGIQAAVMLLPDENREVLQCLLLFLSDMAEYAEYNQVRRLADMSDCGIMISSQEFNSQSFFIKK